MSDPVSNEDIEDVLSSIRRLVSDEPIKGMPRRKLAAVDNVERFVLTPAFRVPDEDLAPEAALEQSQSQEDQGHDSSAGSALGEEIPQEAHPEPDDANDHLPTQDEIDLQPYQSDTEWVEPKPEQNDRLRADISDEAQQEISESETLYLEPAANQDEAPSPDGPSDHETEEARADTHEPHSENTQNDPSSDEGFWQDPSDQAPETQPDPEDMRTQEMSDIDLESLFDDETPEDGAVAANKGDSFVPEPVLQTAVAGQITLEQRIAELEAALQNSAQEWEPDGSEEELTDETRPLSLGKDTRLADAIASVAQTLEKKAPEPDEKWQPSTDTMGPAPIDSLYADAPLPADPQDDTDFADTDTVEWQDVEQEWEPDLDQESGVTLAADVQEDEADHNTAAMQAAAQAVSSDVADADGDNDLFALDDPTTLDEEALQEMVADIVRQELQGVLGERITRNVRRLVRREIKRALAMRDLE